MRTEIGSSRIRSISILLLLSFTRLTNADIIPESTNTEVLVNHSIIFNCSTSENDVIWYRYEMKTNYRTDVYDDGRIITIYADRFRIEKNLTTGAFNLVLLAAKMEDAGKYECVTRATTKTTIASAELIVLYSDPECSSDLKPDGFLAQNICSIEPDNLQLSCSVRYRGNVQPSIEWKNVRPNSSKTNTDDAITLNVTLEADDIANGSSFVCRTKKSAVQEYSCSVNVTKMIYFVPNDTAIEKTIEDEISCSVKSSQQCTYVWYDDERFSVISKQTFRPKERGNYTCEAQCKVRGRTCTFTAQRIYVVPVPVPPNDNNNQLLWLLILPILAGIVAIGLIIYVIYKRYQQRDRPRRSSNTERLPESENLVELNSVTTESNQQQSAQMKPCLEETPSKETDLEPFVKMEHFLHKGALGELYGPFDWKCNNSDKQFICRRIPFVKEKYTADLKDIFHVTAEKWMNLDHQHVLGIYYAGVREKPNSVFLYMMIEYVEGSDLKATLKSCKSKLPLNIVKDWAKQVAEGMNYLHEREIIHKHLKSQHVIFEKPFDPSNTTPDIGLLKIAGYTLSVEQDYSQSISFQGMFSAMAPESLKDSAFTKHSDVYSYAMLILEIINKKSPSEGLKPQDRFALIGKPQLEEIIPRHYPPRLHDLIRKCLDNTPESRPSFESIVSELQEIPVKMPIFEGTPSEETDLEPFFKTDSFLKKGLMGDLHGPFEWVNDKTIEPFICRRFSIPHDKYKDEVKTLFLENTKKWMTLRHRNILSIYYAGTRERTNAVFLYMMIEYGAGGDLKAALKLCQSTLPQSEFPLLTIKDWAKQIAEGMKYLHENGIVHKFPKSELVILERPFDPSNPTPNTLKITGFTLSVEQDHSASTSFGGMFTAMAPESLKDQIFTEHSDVYSYAVIVWEIVNRKILSDGLKQKDKLDLIGKTDLAAGIPDSYPVELRNLVQECSGVDPKTRPTFAEIIPRLDQIPDQS